MSVSSAFTSKLKRESAWWGLFLVVPAVILLFTFQILPILYTIRLSVAENYGFQVKGFVGLDNYIRLFSDNRFLSATSSPPTGALMNTVHWVMIAVPLVIILGLLVALAADHSRHQKLIRGAFFLPMTISGTAVAVMYLFVYAPNPDIGLLNAALNLNQAWLGDPNTVNPSLMAAWIWGQTGMSVVIIAAALKGISTEMIEAARIDGAQGWSMLWYITLPSIRTQMSFLLVTQLVQVLKVFDIVYVMTNGGPAGVSRTMALLFYDQTFDFGNPQYGAATVVIMSLIIALLFTISRRTGKQGKNVK
jgi:alpha-glucoside transport system permease protein